MAAIAEFKEFFIRNTQVNTGSTPDQETGFDVSYYVEIDGVSTLVYNRFLEQNYPSAAVFAKLFQSITFKLNLDDSATATAQGLVSIATNTEAMAGTDTDATGYPLVIKPSQLKGITPIISNTLNATGVSTSATIGEDDLMTYTLPAGTLASAGDYLVITGRCWLANNTNEKRFYLRFNTPKIDINLAFTSTTEAADRYVTMRYEIHYISSTSFMVCGKTELFYSNNAGDEFYFITNTTFDPSVAQIFALVGDNRAAVADEIKGHQLMVELYRKRG